MAELYRERSRISLHIWLWDGYFGDGSSTLFCSTLDYSFSELRKPILFSRKVWSPPFHEVFRKHRFWIKCLRGSLTKTRHICLRRFGLLNQFFLKDPREHLTPKLMLSENFMKRILSHFFRKKNRLTELGERAFQSLKKCTTSVSKISIPA